MNMRVQVICFSPSGNTLEVSSEIQRQLTSRNIPCEVTNMTADPQGVLSKAWSSSLRNRVKPHDILIVGGPVYAHHLHYTVQDLLQCLPPPDSVWGKMAIPFVTYGGISSGIALKEAGALLHKAGRTVIAGMKVSSSHRMTRAFMEHEFNSDLPQEPMTNAVSVLVNRIVAQEFSPKAKDNIRSLSYNGMKAWLKANLIFQEKKWHRARYPKIMVDQSLCTGCGKCMKNCPVLHLQKNATGKVDACQGECIHCLNCVTLCPQKAIRLQGDMEKGRRFMTRMIECHANKETPATAVYPLRENKMLAGKSRMGNFLFKKMLGSLNTEVRAGITAIQTLEYAGIAKAKNILEVGCGSGFYTRQVPQILPDQSKYTAIDLHPEAVAQTTRHFLANPCQQLCIVQENALQTRFVDHSFDLILLFGIVPSPFLPLDQLMPEMLRLLSSDGIIAVWSLDKFWNKNKLSGYRVNYLGTDHGVHRFQKVADQ